MPEPTQSSVGGSVGLGYQLNKDTVPTTFNLFDVTGFTDQIDWVESEQEDEIGGNLDEATPTRYGHQGVLVTGEGRARVGNGVGIVPGFGMRDAGGGIRIFTGVNDVIRVTDEGGGPVDVNLLTGTGFTLVAGTLYNPTEFAAGLKAVLDADTTLSQTYTVTYDAVTGKWTIEHAGTTLELHWSTGTKVQEMLGNLLGYDVTADDTGATSYVGDYARDYVGRWWLANGFQDTWYVTDDGGVESIDFISGTGAVLENYLAYNAWVLAAGMVAALDNGAVLTEVYTMLFDEATNKFTVSNAGTTLELDFTHVDSNYHLEMGYTATDHTGATTYTSDAAILPAKKHTFTPFASGDDYPYLAFYNAFATGVHVRVTEGIRLNSLEFDAGERAPVRWTFGGRGITRKDPAGTPTLVGDTANLVEPHTGAGHTRFFTAEGTPASYRVGTFNLALGWEELIEPAQTQIYPYNISPGRRTATGRMLVYAGAEDDGALMRTVDYGSDAGTEPDTTIVVRELDIMYQSGQVVPNQVGSTERYAIRFMIPECHLRNLDDDRSGLEKGTLEMGITRAASNYYIGVVNDADYGAYEYSA